MIGGETTEEMDKQGQRDANKGAADRDMWGYVVCFGVVITFIAGIGHVNSFGLIYNDFIINTNSTAKSLTTAHGVFAVMLAVGGIILNILPKKITLRKKGIFGAIIFSLGSFTTILITNTNQLPFTFGVLQGIGFGMMVPICYTTLNYYFVRKRTTVMSICKAIQGVVLMGYPQLIKKMMSIYGFRGTLLVISGISLHTLAGMVVMKTDSMNLRNRKAANTGNIEDGKKEHELVDLMNGAENVQVSNNNDNKSNYKKARLQKILEVLNLNILEDIIYYNICVGQSFVNFSDLTFFILQPMLLFQYGYDTTQVATCISICAGADVAGRCALALLSSIIHINTRVLFYFSTVFTFIFRIVILQANKFFWVATVTGVLGVLRAWLHVSSPLVISNHVSHQDFPGAYAFFMLSTGLVNVVFAPIIGLLKDIYQDYVPAFYALTVCCLPCLLLWPLEYKVNKK